MPPPSKKKRSSTLANTVKNQTVSSPDCSYSKRSLRSGRTIERERSSSPNIITSPTVKAPQTTNTEPSQEALDLARREKDLNEKEEQLIAKDNYLNMKEISLEEQAVEINMAKKEMERTRLVTQALITKGSSTALNEMITHLQSELVKKEKNLQDSKENIKRVRAKYEATAKREKRLRAPKEERLPPPQDTRKQSSLRFLKCDGPTQTSRIDACIDAIHAATGLDKSDKDFPKNLKRVIFQILESLSMRTAFTADEDMQFTTLFSLPNTTREAIRAFFRQHLYFDPFWKNSDIREKRMAAINRDDWIFCEFPDDSGAADGKKGKQLAFSYYNNNVKGTVDEMIMNLNSRNKIITSGGFDRRVQLVFMVDKGGSHTKCGFSLSNLKNGVGSPNNFTLLGITSLSESYDNVKKAFGNVLTQLDRLNGSTLKTENEELTYRLKIGGDYKAIAMLLGHAGASSRYYCPSCMATKTTMKCWDSRCIYKPRDAYTIGEHNITRDSLLPSVKASDIVPPTNHILTGIVKKGMKLLQNKIDGEASEWSPEEEERLETVRKDLRIAANGLERIRKFKAILVNAMHAVRNSNLNDNGLDLCGKFCVYPFLKSTEEGWDFPPCKRCTKPTHVICSRSWDSEACSIEGISDVQCLDCKGFGLPEILANDELNIELLDEHETELIDALLLLEMEQSELATTESRTSEKLSQELAKMKLDCGVYQRFYYDDLVGTDARRLTKPENARKLWALVEDKETRNNGIDLFDTIYGIFSILHAGFQTQGEKIAFRNLLERMQTIWTVLNPAESVTLKIHGLTHLADCMESEGHAGREIELIEHVHHSLNVLWPRYLSVTPLEYRLFIIVSRFSSKNSLLLI